MASADTTTRPRFYVIETWGYGLRAHSHESCSLAILDRAYCHREVYRDGPTEHSNSSYKTRRANADQRCAELNAKHGPWPS